MKFSTLSHNIQKKVRLIVTLMLLVYLLIIFSVYSFFLLQDYTNKTAHIGTQIVIHFKLRNQIIEESVANVVKKHTIDLNTNFYMSDIFYDCRSSNSDILYMFFYNQNDAFYSFTDSSKKYPFIEYVKAAREDANYELAQSRWSIFQPVSSDRAYLMYSLAIYQDNAFIGYLVTVPDIQSYIQKTDLYHNSFTQNATIVLVSPENTSLVLNPSDYSDTPADTLPFSPEEDRHQTFDHLIYSYPVLSDNLSFQIHFLVKYVYMQSTVMAVVLIAILVFTGILCKDCIVRYTEHVSNDLIALSDKLENLSEAEAKWRKQREVSEKY